MPAAALLAAALALHAAAWRAGPVLAAVRVSTRPLVMAVRDWRLFGVDIPVLTEPAEAPTLLREAAARCLAVPEDALESITLVRRSLDARQQRTNGRRGKPTGKHEALWSHVIDVRISASAAKRIKVKPGRCVPVASERASEPRSLATPDGAADAMPAPDAPHVVVIGAGPCGLFAALELCRAGVRVTLCERGKPVEERGRSIGALVRRGMVDPESNFCYGEGGAGTWSDGKLTTRIGRNSVEVQSEHRFSLSIPNTTHARDTFHKPFPAPDPAARRPRRPPTLPYGLRLPPSFLPHTPVLPFLLPFPSHPSPCMLSPSPFPCRAGPPGARDARELRCPRPYPDRRRTPPRHRQPRPPPQKLPGGAAAPRRPRHVGRKGGGARAGGRVHPGRVH